MTAFDLRPGVDSVFRADVLALRVGERGTAPATSPPTSPADGAGLLHALPRGAFHVVVLSLVLSYIPDALQRTQARRCCARARHVCALQHSAFVLRR